MVLNTVSATSFPGYGSFGVIPYLLPTSNNVAPSSLGSETYSLAESFNNLLPFHL